MKSWKKYTALNASMLVGFFVSLYVLPSSTHFWPLAIAFLVFLASINYALFRRLRQTKNSQTERPDQSAIIAALILVFLDSVLSRILHLDMAIALVIAVLLLLALIYRGLFDRAN
jgi:hypothetical protein